MKRLHANLLSGVRRKPSVVFKYFFLYATIAVVMLGIVFPVYQIAANSARANAINELSVKLTSDSGILNSSFEKVMLLNNNMVSAIYAESKLYVTTEISSEQLYNLIAIKDNFSKMTANIELPSEFYIMYRYNEHVITHSEVSLTLGAIFSSRLLYHEYTSAEIHSLVTSGADYYSFIPATPVSLDGIPQGNCLTLITQAIGSSAAICAIYSEYDLARHFGLNLLHANAFLAVYDKSGTPLTTHNVPVEQADFTVLRAELPTTGGYVLLGVPEQYYQVISAPVRRIVAAYMIVAGIIGLLLAVGCTLYSYMPIRRLLLLPMAEGTFKIGQGNEFTYIRSMSEQLYDSNRRISDAFNSIEKSLHSSLLVNLLFGAVFTCDNRTVILNILPILSETCRVALIDIGYDLEKERSDEISAQVFAIFSAADFLTVHVSLGKLAVLLRESAIDDFTKAVRETNLLLSRYETRLAAVVSNTFTGPDSVKKAFDQVQFAVALSDSEISYCQSADSADGRVALDLRTLAELTRRGDCGALEECFLGMVHGFFSGQYKNTDTRRFFYLLLSALVTIKADGKHNLADIPMYRPEEPAMDQFNHLCDMYLEQAAQTRQLFNVKCDYKQRLIEYVDKNFSNPDLYAASVAEVFGISSKQVYRILHDATAMGFSDYLEQLRMKESARLLVETGKSIKEISKICGFSTLSSFFRSFKKFYNTSPSIYRKGMSDVI